MVSNHLQKNILNDAQLLRFSRQILLPAWDIAAQLKLFNARVLMIGIGGIGCPSATLLARAGLGFLRIVDGDVVDESNLQRQTLFLENDVGQYKVIVAQKKLKKINPWIEVDAIKNRATAHNLEQLMHDVDVVLDGSDNFATRDAVNLACISTQTPLISAAAIGIEGQLTMITPTTGCYRCLFGETDFSDEQTCAASGVLATTPSVIASLQAHATLMYLGLGKTPLTGKLLVWDGLTLEQRMMHFSKDSFCQVCGDHAVSLR